MDKTASSEASWALITEGVTAARLEAHRVKHLLNRGIKIVEGSPAKAHIHQVAGDIIRGAPNRLQRLEMLLDRTSLALSKMGEDFLGARLPLSEKQLVEDAVEPAGGFKKSRVQHLASRWVKRNASHLRLHKGDNYEVGSWGQGNNSYLETPRTNIYLRDGDILQFLGFQNVRGEKRTVWEFMRAWGQGRTKADQKYEGTKGWMYPYTRDGEPRDRYLRPYRRPIDPPEYPDDEPYSPWD
jgi:hypothetical protein